MADVYLVAWAVCLVGAAGHASEAAGHGAVGAVAAVGVDPIHDYIDLIHVDADTVCPSHLDADPMRDEIHLICIDAVEAHLIA